MSTEYSYTCDRCFLLSPDRAVAPNFKGARRSIPSSWIAVRIIEDNSETLLHFCPECRDEFGKLVTNFCKMGKVEDEASGEELS